MFVATIYSNSDHVTFLRQYAEIAEAEAELSGRGFEYRDGAVEGIEQVWHRRATADVPGARGIIRKL